MRFFWYLETKLDHLFSQQGTPLDTLKAGLSSLIKAEIKVSIVSVGLERKSSEVDAKQIRALERRRCALKLFSTEDRFLRQASEDQTCRLSIGHRLQLSFERSAPASLQRPEQTDQLSQLFHTIQAN